MLVSEIKTLVTLRKTVTSACGFKQVTTSIYLIRIRIAEKMTLEKTTPVKIATVKTSPVKKLHR